MNEQALKIAAEWAKGLKAEKDAGLDVEASEHELMAYLLQNGLQSFIAIDYEALEKQL